MELTLWQPLGGKSPGQLKQGGQKTFGESSRVQMFDLPAKAKQWRDDYARLLHQYGGDGYDFLRRDFEEEVDTVMMPALWLAHHQGVISDEEYIQIGSLIWEEVAEFIIMAKAKKLIDNQLHHYIYGVP